MLPVDSPAGLCLNRRSRGDIAQLIERSIRIAEVEGLNPSISTRYYYFFCNNLAFASPSLNEAGMLEFLPSTQSHTDAKYLLYATRKTELSSG